MAIERAVTHKAPRYVAAVTNEATTVEASVGGDTVEFKVPGARAILRVPIAEWEGFRALVYGVDQALKEKAQVEGSKVPLPWEESALEQQAVALGVQVSSPESVPVLPVVASPPLPSAPGVHVVRDAVTGQPVATVDPDDAIVPDPFPASGVPGPRVVP